MKVYVKADAWNEFGEGDLVQMPVRILNTPKLVESTEPYRIPHNWNPIDGSGGNICYLW